MSRPVQDVTIVWYNPDNKLWEATSPFLPGARGSHETAAGAVMELARAALVAESFKDEVASVAKYIRSLVVPKVRKP